MTEKETTQVLMAISTMFPQFKVGDRATTIRMWTECLADLSYEQVSTAVKAFAMTDTKGFAPSIGQIRAKVASGYESSIMNEAQAWNMVYNALCNSNYHANEEYNKLPEEIRRAVGGPDQLREWAMMDFDSITVAESNFKRTYRAIAEKRAEYLRMPQSMQPVIEAAPLAKIEDKTEVPSDPERASNEYINGLLARWREDDSAWQTA